MASASAFTCITCHVAFSDGDTQRLHYKSDWHRYNLKRKVAELPHVTAERFRERVLAQQELQLVGNNETESLYCEPCKKPFRSHPQYQNHLRSRRHVELQRRWEGEAEQRRQRQLVAEMNRKNNELSGVSEKEGARAARVPARTATTATADDSSDDYDDMETEELDSDEWEELWEGGGTAIPPTACLFCSDVSSDVTASLRHMTQRHAFFIPDVEYVTDMEGLLTYLGQKVGECFVCLWCNERGKHFRSVDAVQKHMRDKGHAKMLHEGAALAEYADFYDYSSSYPTEGEEDDAAVEVLETDGYQLVLPSGALVGHRALARYYRQRLKPEKAVALRRGGSATTARDVAHQYRLMGWTGSDRQLLKRTARDMMALRRHRMREDMRLGVKASKLQKHFRQQNPL